MKRLALAAFVIGCGGGAARPETVSSTAGGDPGIPPALFAGLFVDGRSFMYEVKTETTTYDDADRMVRNATTAKMACRVHGMQNFTRAVAARLECDDDGSPAATPDGIWVATAAGIWRLDAFPLDDAAIAALDPETMILAAQPVEKDWTTDDAEDASGEYRWVERDSGTTWCSIHHLDDGSGDSICFSPTAGLVRGVTSFPGGETKDVTYTLSR